MNTTVSKLQISTPNDLEIVMTRDFAAPRVLVWQAWTQPEHLKIWWGCNQSTVMQCDLDLRVGGAWRIVFQLDGGDDWAFRGVYREIDEPSKLVHTQVFEAMPQHEVLVDVTFEERDGFTTMTETLRHASKESRDAHLQSGLESGVTDSFDKLDVILASLRR